jgi:two-component system sensor histidine kinase UhpB
LRVDHDAQAQRQDEERELREEKGLLEAAWQLQALTRRLVEAEELERRRLAGELHDRVGQMLSALNINLDIALGLVAPQNLEVRLRLTDSLSLVESMLQAIEGLMAELRPPLLDEYGLVAALGHYAKGFSQRHDVDVAVDDPLELARGLPPETAIALFRVAQEALANVAKHARARRVRILLDRKGGELVLEIADDGRGFDPDDRLASSRRWGMTSMRERAAAAGGRVDVRSMPGGGATVRAFVPAGARP